MDYFRLPASIRDIARAISRTAWRSVIKEDDVEEIVKTIPVIECIDGKYIIRKKTKSNRRLSRYNILWELIKRSTHFMDSNSTNVLLENFET